MTTQSPPVPHEHDESPRQRLARNYGEQLQEVRVAQTGVQFLLAFLLALAFTPRFPEITGFQEDVYVVALVLGASATALLIAPAAYHRLVFRRGLKHRLVHATAMFTLAGLTLLMLAIGASLLLVLDVVVGGPQARWLTGGVLCWFGLWWFAVPLWTRRHGRQPDSR
ncbi:MULTISPECIES: DUF6328 family protein [Actinokineospora]|uniref:Membrane protein n=1 Tax=Actinokineospora fastidiosa TaxID=1816 RepID=A0A918GHM3_9PSEU|nr:MULTISPECIES: DUF6328 family protein [Actinokineospora]UVS80125.1 hypothetical protein Actkin_03875 [Actinokineospora sp. UTMC 2448]GGS33223.1 membrane protein [Actinokineospora fastidiosa]